ncbi:MAG TPA: hypothetical protein VFB72_18015 [Verrucomicrobiae bacterium]|nr:hypothetical protein [Verrucomicrobiae bacterium]
MATEDAPSTETGLQNNVTGRPAKQNRMQSGGGIPPAAPDYGLKRRIKMMDVVLAIFAVGLIATAVLLLIFVL